MNRGAELGSTVFGDSRGEGADNVVSARNIPGSGPSLGGIGTGGIELWADGIFRAPLFTNPGPWAHGFSHSFDTGIAGEPPFSIEDLFFILRVESPSRGVQMRFLFVGQPTAFNSWGHMARGYKYARIPTVPKTKFTARFPFVRLQYCDPTLPLDLSLCAWSPFVPHDLEKSCLPGLHLDFTARNRTDEVVRVSLLASLTNLAGWDLPTPAQKHEVFTHRSGAHGVLMRGGEGQHPTAGEMVLFAVPQEGQNLTELEAHPWIENAIWPFWQTGRLDGSFHLERLSRVEYLLHSAEVEARKRKQVSAPGLFRNRCLMALGQSLERGAQCDLKFGVSWYFPWHFDRHGKFAGKYYATLWNGAREVAERLADGAQMDENASRLLPELLEHSALPRSLVIPLLDQLSTLVKSSWLTRSGDFFLWEGLGHASSNTVDVDHYGSYAVALLFPELRRRVIRMAVAAQRKADGQVAHGFQSNVEIADIPASEYRRWDVNAQFVLAAYREWRWGGEKTFLEEIYPACVAAINRLRSQYYNGLSIPIVGGRITYDHWNLEGLITYLAVIHLAALAALREMALQMGEKEEARRCARERESAVQAVEKILWDATRKHYLMVYPLPTRGETTMTNGDGQHGENKDIFERHYGVNPNVVRLRESTGCHTDALNGETTAGLLALPRALDAMRSMLHAETVFHKNFVADAHFLANGNCPTGFFPDEWPMSQWHNPWTGVEYFFAAELALAFRNEKAQQLLDAIFSRSQEQGFRFNHPECGNFYSRALSIYATYLAMAGIHYDAVSSELFISPINYAFVHKLPVITPAFLGRCILEGAGCELHILSGTAALRAVHVEIPTRLETCKSPETYTVSFPEAKSIRSGESVTLKVAKRPASLL